MKLWRQARPFACEPSAARSSEPIPRHRSAGTTTQCAWATSPGPGAGSVAGKAGDARPEDRDAFGAPGAGSVAGKAGDARPEDRDAFGAPGAHGYHRAVGGCENLIQAAAVKPGERVLVVV